jgi:hypothetical protein
LRGQSVGVSWPLFIWQGAPVFAVSRNGLPVMMRRETRSESVHFFERLPITGA